MTFLSDKALERLREVVDSPDLEGTRYQLRERLGRGGMGVVYRAWDRELERDVALKVLDLAAASETAAERMLREARILAQLEHPGIVPVHDVGVLPDGRVFYAMKLVRGSRLDEFRRNPLAERLRLFPRLCEAVAFAHNMGVIHRDLKPANIMLGAFGEVLVMDWGVARMLGEAAEPRGIVVGTEGYMAPEQARGEANVDVRADVFGLGAILAFLLEGDELRPRPLKAIIAKATAPNPDDRYPTALALAEDVTRFADGLPVHAYRENPLEAATRFLRRYQAAIVLVVAYLIMRSLFFFFYSR